MLPKQILKMKKYLLFTFILLINVFVCSQTIYVTSNGAGLMDGSNWNNALNGNGIKGNGYTILSDTLRTSNSGSIFWIAAGVYTPCVDNDREKHFVINENIEIYGGFNGTETILDQRDFNQNQTIFSGDIGVINDSLDNSYHVVCTSDSIPLWQDTSKVDHIYITNGVANGSNENAIGGGILIKENSIIEINCCQIKNNTALGNLQNFQVGGGIMNKGKLFITHSDISDNIGVIAGGGVYNISFLKISNCSINRNRITTLDNWGWNGCGGAALYNYINSTIEIDSCRIDSNYTPLYLRGTGLYNRGKATIHNSFFENNISDADGAGIYSTSPIRIFNCNFINNRSNCITRWVVLSKGALIVDDSLTIDHCKFDYSSSIRYPCISSTGYASIKNCEFSHCFRTYETVLRGGGIYCSGKTIIDSCNFHDNNLGGMEYINTGGMFNIIVIHTGSDGGGILYDGTDTIWINNSIFHNNIATGGGAIAIYSGTAIIKNTKVTDNYGYKGSGIMNYSNTYILNSFFTNNRGGVGGVICNLNLCQTNIINSTFAYNTGTPPFFHGDIDYAATNSFQIYNSIIKSENGVFGFYNNVFGADTIQYSCISGGFPGVGNIGADPMFISPSTGQDTTFDGLQADWRLSACSPCLNSGMDSLTNEIFDMDGNNRKFNKIDMGAYEHNYIAPIETIIVNKIGKNCATLYWKNKIDPCHSVVFIKDTCLGTPIIHQDSTYSYSSEFGLGSVSNGWYCIYFGNDTSSSITGLSEGKTYRIAIFNFVLDSMYIEPSFLNFSTEKIFFEDTLKAYGDEPFLLQPSTVSGINNFVFSIDNETVANIENDSLKLLNAGTINIKIQHYGNEIYLPDTTEYTILVNKAPLSIIAENKTRFFGESNPELTFELNGFKNNDSIGQIDSIPIIYCNADETSDIGQYSIFFNEDYDNNYTFEEQNGVLTIQKLIKYFNNTTSICEGDSIMVGNHVYYQNGSFNDTIQMANIDSIINTILSVISYDFHFNDTICEGSTYHWEGNDYAVNGNYSVIYNSFMGCDSLLNLNLVVNPKTYFTDQEVGCDQYTWIDGITYNSNTTSPMYITTNQFGCDSVITLDLTINHSTTFTDIQSACNYYNWIDGIIYTSSISGPVYTIMNSNDCDSIITLMLTINYSKDTTFNTKICEGDYFMFNEQIITVAGLYNDTLTTLDGCDSILKMHLYISPTYLTELEQTINQGDTIQFYDQSIYETGVYEHILVSQDGCDSIIRLNLNENNSINNFDILSFSIFPNPFHSSFSLYSLTDVFVDFDVQLYNINGKLIFNQTISNRITFFNMEDYSNGLYLLILKNDQKIIKQFKILKIS